MGSCADKILTTLRVDEETIEYKELIKQIEDFFQSKEKRTGRETKIRYKENPR